MSGIYDLLTDVSQPTLSKEYKAKMVHTIPQVEVIDRAPYVLKAAHKQTILDLGCIGPMGDALRGVAKEYHGVDVADMEMDYTYYRLNLDAADSLPDIPDLDLIVAGEIIEHVSNAGHMLDLMHKTGVPVILTTPNAFSASGMVYLAKGIELVNKEHVSWYSYKTLTALIARHRFRVVEWFWYNGKPLVAEGLVFRLEPK